MQFWPGWTSEEGQLPFLGLLHIAFESNIL
jgi:hypothetical protein